jgi:hypothetical protein
MAPELGEGVPAFRYREVLARASAVSFVSTLLTFWVRFPKDESRLLGLLAQLLFRAVCARFPPKIHDGIGDSVAPDLLCDVSQQQVALRQTATQMQQFRWREQPCSSFRFPELSQPI